MKQLALIHLQPVHSAHMMAVTAALAIQEFEAQTD